MAGMRKLLVFLLGLGAIWAAFHYYFNGPMTSGASTAPSAPKQKLDNVHNAANRIEADGQRRADEAAGHAE
jgi:hypothetical protein